MAPGDLVGRFRQGPQPISALMYFDAADFLEEVHRGFVILHFLEAQADVVLYAIVLETGRGPADSIRFEGRCRLERDEGQCRVELWPNTLMGTAQLLD